MGGLLKNIQYNRCTDAVFYQILCTVWYLLKFSLGQVWPLAGQLGVPAVQLYVYGVSVRRGFVFLDPPCNISTVYVHSAYLHIGPCMYTTNALPVS